MKFININLHPPGGYVFRDSDGVVHKSTSWPGVVRVLSQYRALTGKLAGNPAAEVTAAVCQASPHICREGKANPLAKADQENFTLRVQNWLHRLVQQLRRQQIKYVGNSNVARERAEICRKCPAQRAWEKSCQTCSKATGAIQKNLMQGRPDVGKSLLGCEILSEDTQVSVHIQEPPAKVGALPANCWRRK